MSENKPLAPGKSISRVIDLDKYRHDAPFPMTTWVPNAYYDRAIWQPRTEKIEPTVTVR